MPAEAVDVGAEVDAEPELVTGAGVESEAPTVESVVTPARRPVA